MLERLRTMMRKETIVVLRDPRMRTVVFVAPIIQLVIFGYAANTDVRHARTAIMDLDNTPASRSLIARFIGSDYFRAVGYVDNSQQAQNIIDRGNARAVIRIAKGFQEDLDAGRTAQVQLIVDGVDSSTAGVILKYAGEIASVFSQEQIDRRLNRLVGAGPRPGAVVLEPRVWFNENLESRNFYVPGIIANLVMLITLILTSMSIVREREIGTMEQVMVTPIRPVEFILGKTIPFAIISFIVVLLVTTVGVFWFKVPIRGSLALLALATALYLLSASGLGLFVSTICKTQQQAMMSTFFIIFPAILLSGFVFPIANMPLPVRWLTLADPLRYFIVVLRGIFLKGVGFWTLWPQLVGLAVIGISVVTLAAKRFHKTLG
jgi:ABC-2 type transport system permease protein